MMGMFFQTILSPAMNLLRRVNIVCLSFVYCSLFATSESKNETLSRNKRYLVFPMGGTFKLVIGFGIPVKLGLKQSMAIGWNFQWQYPAPQNITQLQVYPPIVGRSRRKRENYVNDRPVFYAALESLMSRDGVDGRACLQRSICENALSSAHHQANGLYGQLLHVALTPKDGPDDIIGFQLDPVYIDARRAGHFGADCQSLYPACPPGEGLLDLITMFDD